MGAVGIRYTAEGRRGIDIDISISNKDIIEKHCWIFLLACGGFVCAVGINCFFFSAACRAGEIDLGGDSSPALYNHCNEIH